MKLKKIITAISGIVALAACFMLFLPQITMSYSILTDKGNVVVSGPTALFGGEIYSGAYRIGDFKGAVLGFIGYVFVGVAGLFLIASIFTNHKPCVLVSKLIALVFAGTGLGFVWSTKVNFTYVNAISEGSSKSAFTITSIGQAYGLIIGIMLSILVVLGIIASFCVDTKKK